jgi:uncharacterized protein
MKSLSLYQEDFAGILLGKSSGDMLSEMFSGNVDRSTSCIALYRGNLHASWQRALSAAYPVLKAVVGDDFFNELALVYGRVYPSESGDLNEFGEDLPAFVRDLRAAADYQYFGDLARLEWAVHRAHYAENPLILEVDRWREIDVDVLLGARLRVSTACTLVSSRFCVGELWRAHQSAQVHFPVCMEEASYSLVVRPHWSAYVIDLTAGGRGLFEMLMAGSTLEQALDRACALESGFDLEAHWNFWIASGAIVGLSIEQDSER